jgi:hypothetical protein
MVRIPLPRRKPSAWRLALLPLLVASACATAPPGAEGSDASHPTDPSDSGIEGPDTRGDAGTADALSMPEKDAGAAAVRVVVLADLNESYGSLSYREAVTQAVARTVALKPDLVLSAGDMVAGQKAGLDYRAMWKAFHTAVSDPLARAGLPFAVTPGNHDGSAYPLYAAERAEFVAQWSARRPAVSFQEGKDYPLRYSFTMGPALFVFLDATTVGPLGSDQLKWIDRELRAGAAHPVKVVVGHVPLYAFAQGVESEILRDAALERLLIDRGVDLFVTGHHHAFYPGRRSGLRLVGAGCLGGGPRSLLGDTRVGPRSLLVLELSPAGAVSVEALEEPDFVTRVPRSALPAQIGNGSQVIVRDDL